MMGLILATDGFEDSEFSYPYYRAREDGWEVDVATPDGEAVEGKHGYEFDADLAIDEHEPEWYAEEYDFLLVPGGGSPEALRTEAPAAAEIVSWFDEYDRPIGAICHGPQLLISADVLEGREATAYWPLAVDVENAGAEFVDEAAVVDGNLVTARVPEDLPAFTSRLFELVEEELAIPA